jgi:uncharacterized phage protein (TIGR01671 family)
MNRTIKFRGKRVDNGEWVYGFVMSWKHFDGTKYVQVVSIKNDAQEYVVIPETVGQFTGLLDKNGKEIYEGDYLMQGNGFLWEVFYSIDRIQLKRKGMKNEYHTVYVSLSSILGYNSIYEVIGNIHDNPELLNNNR